MFQTANLTNNFVEISWYKCKLTRKGKCALGYTDSAHYTHGHVKIGSIDPCSSFSFFYLLMTNKQTNKCIC